MTRKTKGKWATELAHLAAAAQAADQIVQAVGLKPPIDPLEIVKAESRLLKAAGCDLKNRYDGQLEYHRKKDRFLLYYNTKYDTGRTAGDHHPRTRFSIGHELDHYFLSAHRAFLMRTGTAHRSSAEFRNNLFVEREADAFASGLLLPAHAFEPAVNDGGELSLSRVKRLADRFQASLIATAIRAVRLSNFPCGIVGIREGQKAWCFASESLVDIGAFPAKGGLSPPRTALGQWGRFERGQFEEHEQDGNLTDWFQTYERDELGGVLVTESYISVPTMKTLLVLLTADESDLCDPDEDESDEEEGYIPSRDR